MQNFWLVSKSLKFYSCQPNLSYLSFNKLGETNYNTLIYGFAQSLCFI